MNENRTKALLFIELDFLIEHAKDVGAATERGEEEGAADNALEESIERVKTLVEQLCENGKDNGAIWVLWTFHRNNSEDFFSRFDSREAAVDAAAIESGEYYDEDEKVEIIAKVRKELAERDTAETGDFIFQIVKL